MDPLRAFIDLIQQNLGGHIPQDTLRSFETATLEYMAKFELVPKHEYEAHLDILKSLQAQVGTLEQRLKQLEETH
jgi:BMFP domain-containing protein YqiC